MGTWAVQDAKAKFSELMDTAERSGPQMITRRGVEVAVLCTIDEWKRMNTPTPPQFPKKILSNDEFLKLLQSAPDFEIPDRHADRLSRRRARGAK